MAEPRDRRIKNAHGCASALGGAPHVGEARPDGDRGGAATAGHRCRATPPPRVVSPARVRTSDFDFELPDELIARVPLAERDASRLLVLPRDEGALEHRTFRELPQLLRGGDLLVANDARVIRARLRGHKPTGGRAELLVCDPLPSFDGRARFRCMGQSSKGLPIGQRLSLGADGSLAAEIVGVEGGGFYSVAFDAAPDALFDELARVGELPLPPYFERAPAPEDEQRYQTLFATTPGAVAAPTAGLHFTPAVLDALATADVQVARLTLHVGPGTFLPVRADRLDEHVMHEERFDVPAATAHAIEATRAAGGRVIAVGTTSLRALEAATRPDGTVIAGANRTAIFLHPGVEVRAVDGLLTNFHLPRSTLVMLVAALVGRDRLLGAYAEAIERKYRFYSYGDAMFIAPGS